MGKKYLNFLILPEPSSRNIKIRLSLWKVRMVLGLLGLVIIVLIVLTLVYGRVVSEILSGKSLRRENERLREYNARVVELEKELRQYRRFTQRVAELAGIENPFPVRSQPTETSLASLRRPASPLDDTEIHSALRSTEMALTQSERPHAGEDAQALVEPDSLARIPRGQPINGWITRGFSLKEHVFEPEHTGIDFAAKEGTPVIVTADGKVSFAGWDDVYGHVAVVDHGNSYVTYYGHNSKILVNSGDLVKRGEVIALSGNSGRSSAPHLHYEIRVDDVPIDPKNSFNPK
jgi:murein DD-endopeptidase MepM/ murein hydrolase activator NlpD